MNRDSDSKIRMIIKFNVCLLILLLIFNRFIVNEIDAYTSGYIYLAMIIILLLDTIYCIYIWKKDN